MHHNNHHHHGFQLFSSPFHQTLCSPTASLRILSSSSSSSSSHTPCPARIRRSATPSKLSRSRAFPNLRRLTSRVVELARRRQLHQIFEEIELAKERYGKLNTIVMNAVMEACVHCGDVDSSCRVFDEMSKPDGCGVDCISFGILLKGLGKARRVDEAFQILESLERNTAAGRPALSAHLIYGLLNSLLEAGDMRRANGLIARYRYVLHDDTQSILLYNLLIKGYANSDFPLGALTVRDEILRQGLKPDKTTYNTLVYACVKSGRSDAAIQLLAEMKVSSKYLEEAERSDNFELIPDAVTYTTLLKGLGKNKDLSSVMKIVVEMKSLPGLFIDRTAYSAIVDALLACGSIQGALCIYGEIIKQSGKNNILRPKPHLYLSLMRALALRGDCEMVKRLHARMWFDSAGSISSSVQREADELLMEAAINDYQVTFAKNVLSEIITRREGFSWRSRGGMVAIQVEAFSGFTSSLLNPYILPQVSVDDPVEKYMTTFDEAKPLPASLTLNKAVMRFFRDSVVPIVDEWGSCVGIVHRTDCNKLDDPLSSMIRGPPPCITTSTSIGRVIDLILEKKYEMLVVVKNSNVYETSYSSSSRPVGVFTLQKFLKHIAATTTNLEDRLQNKCQQKSFVNSVR